jgi:hypothetical protein
MKRHAQFLTLAAIGLACGPAFASSPDGLFMFFIFTPAATVIGVVALVFLISPAKPRSGFLAGLVLTIFGIANLVAGWSMWSRERLLAELGSGVWNNEAVTAGLFLAPIILSAALVLRHWPGRAA